jgi:hypothetical protein
MRSIPASTGAPLVALCVLLGLLAFATYRYRRASPVAHSDPLTEVFARRELRKLNTQLERVAEDERSRLARNVASYIAGDVGHVVLVADQPRDVLVLLLSDGRLLTLNGVTRVTRGLLLHRAANDKLRPAGVDNNISFCHLRLRGDSGREMTISTHTVSLTQ